MIRTVQKLIKIMGKCLTVQGKSYYRQLYDVLNEHIVCLDVLRYSIAVQKH